MNLDNLLPNLGEWLRGTGPESDVVVSTRIRLARNLSEFPFTNRATHTHKSEIVQLARDALAKANLPSRLDYLDVPSMPALDRQFLVERQLISRELAAVLDGPRGVAFDVKESVSVMVNEEDHLRLQVLRSGFDLEEAWSDIDRLDDALEARLNYAFHTQFGYLTACPTNVGTGLRASVMLHLPALGLTKQIEKVFRALQKINLAVRGLHGEGSRAFGDLYQISNQVTLGKAESKDPRRDPRGDSDDPAVRAPGPHRPHERAAAGGAGPRCPGTRHARQRHHDHGRRDDGAALRRPARHSPALARRRDGDDGEPVVHPDAGGPLAETGRSRARRRGAQRGPRQIPQEPAPRTRFPSPMIFPWNNRPPAPKVGVSKKNRVTRKIVPRKSPALTAPVDLLGDVRALIERARDTTARTVNAALVLLYWSIGDRIRREILKEKRAEYGEQIVQTLSAQLTSEYGRGYGRRNLFNMIRLAEVYPQIEIVQTLFAQLGWSHFLEIIYFDDPLKRDFYAEMCRVERWSVRMLRQKIAGMLFERTALSKMPEKLAKQELAKLRTTDQLSPDLVFRDPYILDFLGLKDTYSESDLEAAILREMESFLIELGAGFTFVARQKRIVIDHEDFYIDLLFFHRKLHRLIAIDLKLGKFQAADKGQMELYLRWLDKHEREPGEESPLGLILCESTGSEQVKLLQLEESGIRVATYLTDLPPKSLLESKLRATARACRAHGCGRVEHDSARSPPSLLCVRDLSGRLDLEAPGAVPGSRVGQS